MTKDEALRRPTIHEFHSKDIDVDVRFVDDDKVWYVSMSRKGPTAHTAVIKTNTTDGKLYFFAEGHKIYFDLCQPPIVI